MPIQATNLKGLVHSLESLLDRFERSYSVRLLDRELPRVDKQGNLSYSIPRTVRASDIRAAWKNDRRKMPESGIVFPDGSVMTVLFKCSPLPVPGVLKPVEQDVLIETPGIAPDPFALVEKYCYCFYPNSEKAEEIGYFRYDFHSESMGTGDLGDHTYFHMHHRKADEGFRLPTGPVMEFDVLVSACEKVLAPQNRESRLKHAFLSGQFESLLLDLTVDGVIRLGENLMNGTEWKSFKHRRKYEAFLDAYV